MKFDANGWLDVAQEIDFSANSMSRQGYGIKYLVLHGTAGGTSAVGIGQYFQSTIGGANPVSSHLIIDQSGVIVQGMPLSLAAWANGAFSNGHASYLPDASINPNLYTASIEFVKSSADNSDNLTDKQKQAGFAAIACICESYNIPKRPGDASGGIIQHADIDPVNRSGCVGAFPWNDLWSFLQGENDVTQAEYDQLYQKYLDVATAYNKVNDEKNSLVAHLNDQQSKLTTLQTAYNSVVTEKNGLVGQLTQLKAQLAQAQKASPAVDTTNLQNQISSLQGRLSQIAALAKL